MKEYAPILLFTYNRPTHTRQLIESLLANEEAAESRLFVYSDAARNAADQEAVAEVRRHLHALTGFLSVEVTERTENQGLAANVIAGVTEQVNRYGRVIVLEDDLTVSPYFLRFMNKALNVYEDEPRVGASKRATSRKTRLFPPLSSSNGQEAGGGPRGSVHGSTSTPTAKPCCNNSKTES